MELTYNTTTKSRPVAVQRSDPGLPKQQWTAMKRCKVILFCEVQYIVG